MSKLYIPTEQVFNNLPKILTTPKGSFDHQKSKIPKTNLTG